MSSTARSKKTKTTNKRQTYTVTLELMTPVECAFDVEATSPSDAIEQALKLDWDDFQYGHLDGDGPTYCTRVVDAKGNELSVPRKFSFDSVNKE